MPYRVLVPEQPTDEIAQGAALLQIQGTRGVVFHSRQDPFAERCAQAVRHGQTVTIPDGCVQVGIYDEYAGELRPDHRGGIPRLEQWIQQRVARNDLEARNNRASNRAQARRLAMQGRTHEAYRLDRRLGF